MIDMSRFKPLTENRDLINELLDQTMNSSAHILELPEGKTIYLYDFNDNFFGLRLLTNDKKDPLSFYPIFDNGAPIEGVIKSVAVTENEYEAIRSIKVLSAYLNTFAQDHVFHKESFPQILNTTLSISFGGFALSQERQLNPPTIKQANGTLVTTKGSSIFYHAKGQPLTNYIYQLNVEEVNSIIWNDLIEIIQIKTILFRFKNVSVDFRLYVTERVLQNDYFPKKGDDVMGIMELQSKLF
jgi:hypothetical protein